MDKVTSSKLETFALWKSLLEDRKKEKKLQTERGFTNYISDKELVQKNLIALE